jgi:hypothetical protein
MNLNNPQDNLAHQVVDLKTRVAHLETLISNNSGLWFPLDFQEITAAPGTLTFSSIPQIYERLKIVFYLQSSRAAASDTLLTTFNSDVGANYTYRTHDLAGGNTVGVGANSLVWSRLAATGVTLFSSGEFEVYDYTSIVNDKQVLGQYTSDNNNHRLAGTVWSPAIKAAITQIDLTTLTSGAFTIGSWVQLYGFLQPS